MSNCYIKPAMGIYIRSSFHSPVLKQICQRCLGPYEIFTNGWSQALHCLSHSKIVDSKCKHHPKGQLKLPQQGHLRWPRPSAAFVASFFFNDTTSIPTTGLYYPTLDQMDWQLHNGHHGHLLHRLNFKAWLKRNPLQASCQGSYMQILYLFKEQGNRIQ